MDPLVLKKHCETTVAMIDLAVSMKPAELVDLRPPVDNIATRCEVAFVFPDKVTANAFFESAKKAAGKL